MQDEEVKSEAEQTSAQAPVESTDAPAEAGQAVVQDKPEDEIYMSLRHVNKIYDNTTQAVFDFNLDVKKHEFVVLVGPSGCGKSTTIRMIAGLENISSGDLIIGGRYANDLSPKERDIAMVFQNYALYPQMSVYDNMAFGLKMRHVDKKVIDEKVRKAAEILELTKYLDRKPKQLSGGQKQRVALGRAIVRNAKIFLMDEPLSNLDAKLRVSMRASIVKLHNQIGATTVYVTHDQTEAMTMATKVVVLKDGHIQQVGSPEEIYQRPSNLFVATFIGSPAMNTWDATMENGKIIVGTGDKVLTFDAKTEMTANRQSFYENALSKVLEEIGTVIKNSETAIGKAEKDVFFFQRGQLKNDLAVISSGKEEAKTEKGEGTPNEAIATVELTAEEKINKAKADIALCSEKVHKTRSALDVANWFPKKKVLTKALEIASASLDAQLLRLEQFASGLSGERCALVAGLRPEEIQVVPLDDPREGFETEVVVAELLGSSYNLHVNLFGKEIVAECHADRRIEIGDHIKVVVNTDKIHLFDKITQLRID